MKIALLAFLGAFGFQAVAAAETVIICDYQTNYRLQFQVEDNTGWILKKTSPTTVALVSSFKFMVQDITHLEGTDLRSEYKLAIPNAIVELSVSFRSKSGEGLMTHRSGKRELLRNCTL